jgi:hypothetical protein
MQMFGMAEKEMEYRVDLFNRWVMLRSLAFLYYGLGFVGSDR